MISYIIPVFNSERTIQRCLSSILEQKGKKEIIVVDNGSKDSTLKVVKEMAEKNPEIKVLKESKKGPAAARNKGLEIVEGDYIAFVDSDVFLPPDWAEKALGKLSKERKVAGAGGPAKNASRGIISELFDPLFLYNLNKTEVYTGSIATMNAMFKREVIKEERYDERLITAEDPDLCFRLRNKGYRLLLSKELEVEHSHPAGIKDIVNRWFNYGKYYFIPYFRFPGNVGTYFLFRIFYVPILIVLIIASYFNVKLLLIPAGMILGVFSMYMVTGWRKIGKKYLKLLFPFLHTFKFLVHSMGIFYGILIYFTKKWKFS